MYLCVCLCTCTRGNWKWAQELRIYLQFKTLKFPYLNLLYGTHKIKSNQFEKKISRRKWLRKKSLTLTQIILNPHSFQCVSLSQASIFYHWQIQNVLENLFFIMLKRIFAFVFFSLLLSQRRKKVECRRCLHVQWTLFPIVAIFYILFDRNFVSF